MLTGAGRLIFTKNRYLIFSDPCHCQSTENSDKLTLPFKLQDLRLALDNVTSHCCCRRRCHRYRVPLPGAATATANRLLLTNVSVSLKKKIIAFSLYPPVFCTCVYLYVIHI